ncbi:LysM domain-containing protein [Fusarium sp. Ph1]|nr:LysM domain-containing protein [Fusarium sp. Ph1]
MRFMQCPSILSLTLAIILPTSSLAVETTTSSTGGCKPSTREPSTPIGTFLHKRPMATPSVPRKKELEAGDINCRGWVQTYEHVDETTCQKLADDYHIDLGTFYDLNPILESDCKRIRPYTEYCYTGFIEPLRAYDGNCGPLYNNATCLGTGKSCCNTETWTCGNRERDCTPSLCYRGAGNCFLRVITSTDGICGLVKDRHTLRVCGKWGDCCNLQNKCGSGPDFCGKGVCQAGECTHSDWPMDERPEQLPWEYGEGDP